MSRQAPISNMPGYCECEFGSRHHQAVPTTTRITSSQKENPRCNCQEAHITKDIPHLADYPRPD
ncbi:hypothetical protein Csa_012877 [Cucumis sativus]|nr:hypothetical protein Csa_012877 [Cucumis sativus]